MRDLKADLELCEKATPGPWGVEHWPELKTCHAVVTVKQGPPDRPNNRGVAATLDLDQTVADQDAAFIAAAREGWPEAIRRAMEAEARVEKLDDLLQRVEFVLQAVARADYMYDSNGCEFMAIDDDTVSAARFALDAIRKERREE